MNPLNIKSGYKGFTLIEVLVALVIFAIGLLGLGLQLSKNLNVTINKEVHSSVMQLALQSVEPLNLAILQSRSNFKQALNSLSSTPAFDTNNSQLNNFTISINSAIDSNGQSVLSSNNLGTLIPPFTVVLNVKYTNDNGESLNFQSTHVFVPPPGTAS